MLESEIQTNGEHPLCVGINLKSVFEVEFVYSYNIGDN